MTAQDEEEDSNQKMLDLTTQHLEEMRQMNTHVQDQFKKNFLLTRDLQYNVQDILDRQTKSNIEIPTFLRGVTMINAGKVEK